MQWERREGNTNAANEFVIQCNKAPPTTDYKYMDMDDNNRTQSIKFMIKCSYIQIR